MWDSETTLLIATWIIRAALGFVIITILTRYWGWLWNYSVIKELHGIKSQLKRIAEDLEDAEGIADNDEKETTVTELTDEKNRE